MIRSGEFPVVRLRRLRQSDKLRRLVRETHIGLHDLVYPLFVASGHNYRREVSSMPGVHVFSVDRLGEELEKVVEAGITAILLFGVVDEKDPQGKLAYDPAGPVQQAIHYIKSNYPQLLVITDVCLCEYTSHGHCGIIEKGDVDNDATLEVLGEVAVSHAAAGADMVAPSDMMDGRVQAIRRALDDNGFSHVAIMSYAAKYASAFYGPFREAADSTPQFGDRRSYQMDPPNVREALREVELDVVEGADIIMVKPALAYLDVIQKVRSRFLLPVAAYNVSGEYAMVKAAAARGWLDEKRIVGEILTAIKRAGADIIITYHALDFARWLQEGNWPL